MALIQKGVRPRPRVGLIGEFGQETIDSFKLLFPTIWLADNLENIRKVVEPIELDLVICASNVSGYIEWLNNVSIISFSTSGMTLSGSHHLEYIRCASYSLTEQFILPDLPLNFARLREVDLSNVEHIRGWTLLELQFGRNTTTEQDKETRRFFNNSSIIFDPNSELPCAVILQYPKSNLGVAYLPNPLFRVLPWVELICTEWAKNDPERFPNFGDWTKMQAWMTKEEELLAVQLDTTEAEKQKSIIEFNQKIGLLQEELLKSSIKAKDGIRKLITEQGDELVNEVSLCLETLGFVVTNMDETKIEGAPKLEDLRIQDIDDPEWEAIIEVRGYSKSGGITSDFSRMARFARQYQAEKGKYPSKQIYIVNGQIDLPPSHRQAPLSSSPDDVTEFGEQDGIVVWSLDLFRLMKNIDETDLPTVRKLIKDTKGRFIYQV